MFHDKLSLPTSNDGSFTPHRLWGWPLVPGTAEMTGDGYHTVACGERAVSAPKEALIRVLARRFGGAHGVSFWPSGQTLNTHPVTTFGFSRREEKKSRKRGER